MPIANPAQRPAKPSQQSNGAADRAKDGDELSQRLASLPPEQRARLQQMLLAKRAAAAPRGIPRRPDTGPCPLSFGQELMWLLDRLTPGISAYNVPRVLRLEGPLHVEALRRALDEVARRHEVLRTTYTAAGGTPVQVVGPAPRVPLQEIDLTGLPPEQRQAEAERISIEASDRGFDLSRDLMLRAVLLRLADREHIFVLVSHHVASDGWSRGLLFRELGALYAAFCQGKPSPLPDVSLQFADFAVWQRDWLQGEVLDKLLAYWKPKLDGAPPLLELPTDHPRPPVQSGRGRRVGTKLPKALAEALKELSRKEGASLFMTGLAAFKALLFRYTGQEDVVVGTPISGRTRTEVEGVVGYFSNSLALRTDLSGDPTFRELLGRVRETALGAYSHQEMPFEKLIVELSPERTLSYTPVYQVMFSVGVTQAEGPEFPGLMTTEIFTDRGTAKFDLTLGMRETSDGLLLGIEHSTDLFEPATMERMLGHFRTLLEDAARHPERRVSELAILTEPERRQLLVDWAGPRRDFPLEVCLHQLFERQVRRTPEAVAVEGKDERLTYRELNARANRIARLLRQTGVRRGDFVAILHERGPDFLVAMLAVFKAGGAYVPIDPSYPPDRVQYLLAKSETRTLLTRAAVLRKYPDLLAGRDGVRVVCLDTLPGEGARNGDALPAVHDARAFAGLPAEDLDNVNEPTDPLYMIFTSGSTGMPKGAVIRHDGAVNHIYAQFDALDLGGAFGFLQSAPSSSDISVWQFLAPLLTGGRTVIIDENDLVSAEKLFATVRRKQVRIVELVPVLMRLLLDHAGCLAPAERALPALRWMMVTGEAAPAELVNAWLRLYPGIPVVNAYGPTEAADDVAQAIIDRPLPEGQQSVPVGRPLANLQIHVLDGRLQLVPVGVTGEICVGGVGVGAGYWKDEEKTRSSFVPDPFSGKPNDRIYRTGDLGRWLPDGTIEFAGRRDDQVKVRGHRIELGEVEAQLRQHPGVREAAVVIADVPPGGKQLVAYAVASRPGVEPGALRAFLKEKLPPHMVPAACVLLESMPRTPNGKVDRRALPAPRAAAGPAAEPGPGSRDVLESQLTLLWEEVLGRTGIGVRENFFDIGGHSLLAARLLARVEKVFGRALPLRALFQAPTIEDLAAVLRREGDSFRWPTLVPVRTGGSGRPLFCVVRPNANPLGYTFLARHLKDDRPLYVLQSPFRAEGAEVYRQEEFAALATEYVREMRAVQPEGPYQLVGHCEGALVAFEMTRQLQAAGQRVGLLGILDAWPVENTRIYLLWQIEYLRRRLPQFRSLRLGEKAANLWRRLFPSRGHAGGGAALAPGAGPGRTSESFRRRYWPGKGFVPPRIDGRIHLFRVRQQPYWRVRDPELGWGARATEGVEVHVISGQHATLLREPQVESLAEQLTECLRRV